MVDRYKYMFINGNIYTFFSLAWISMGRLLLFTLLCSCALAPSGGHAAEKGATPIESVPDKAVIYIVRQPMDSWEPGMISLDVAGHDRRGKDLFRAAHGDNRPPWRIGDHAAAPDQREGWAKAGRTVGTAEIAPCSGGAVFRVFLRRSST